MAESESDLGGEFDAVAPHAPSELERYLAEGPQAFGDIALLALVLGPGPDGPSALQVAAALLEQFGSLHGVATREPLELQRCPGVEGDRAARLHACLEAGRRAVRPPVSADPIRHPQEAWSILGPAFEGCVEEELHALFVNRRYRPIARRCLTRGSDSYTVVDPRQIFRVAVGVGAAGVILAHNHPTGDPSPSDRDRNITDRVARAGQALGIRLLDHLVIGDGSYRSMAEDGTLGDWPSEPDIL